MGVGMSNLTQNAMSNHYLSHADILEKLSPYAPKGWIDRFKGAEKSGQTNWLYLVRDFPIVDPKMEMLVEDIVLALQAKREFKSAVKVEMQKLEAEGKLSLDDPEKEAEWQGRLDAEREAHEKWLIEGEEARKNQREADLQFMEGKKNPLIIKKVGSEESFKIPSIKKEDPNKASQIKNIPIQTKEFIPPLPKIKSIIADGQELLTPSEPAKDKIKSIEGLPKDVVESLELRGISTVEAFKNMEIQQARQILGQTLFKKYESYFKK